MSKGCTVTVDKRKVRQINEAVYGALELTGYTLLDEIKETQVVPYRTGHLQDERSFVVVHLEEREVLIEMQTPYARRLYYHPEYNFNHLHNSNAGAYWFRPWEEGGIYQDRPMQIFSEHLGRLVKARLKG